MLRFDKHPCTREEQRFGNGKIQEVSFLEKDWDGSNLPLDLVKEAGNNRLDSRFSTLGNEPNGEVTQKPKKKVVFLVEPNDFRSSSRRKTARYF